MPTFYADEIAGSTNLLREKELGNRHAGSDDTPRVHIVKRVYTMIGTEAADDVVRLQRGRDGSAVVPHLSSVSSDAIATTATIVIGDDDDQGVGSAADDDRYTAALDVAAAGIDPFAGGAAATTQYKLGADAWYELKFATMATPVAGKKLEILMAVTGY